MRPAMIMQDKMVVMNEAKTLSSEITIHVKVRVFLVLMLHVEMILVTNGHYSVVVQITLANDT